MESNINFQHPYIRLQETLIEQKVMVIDNITSFPMYGESYIAPDLLILICHQGTLWNKNMPDATFATHDVGVLLPEQIVISQRASDDYQATMIAVSRKFSDHLKYSYPYTRYDSRFRRNPAIHLTEEQYNSLLDAVGLLRTLTHSQSQHRSEMLSNLLAIIINMIGEYHISNCPNNYRLKPNELLFNRFYDAIIHHHCESHEVAFYAHICGLSPKHFAEVIKQETNISAFEWIATYVTIQAKSLLDSHQNYTIQQVSNHLGFSEQSSFTRFFKRQTGTTPSEFRNRLQNQ